jgi:LPXTG-site transpeptidase (sortase) family protein
VIDGHFGWRDGLPAVFDNLHKLQKGDKLYVEDKKGLTVTFVVSKLQTFGQDESAPNVFISNDKKAHLNLITCHGIWDNAQRSYSNRLVVFADKEVQQSKL